MEFHKESSSCHISDRGSLVSDGHGKKQPNETSRKKRKRGKEKQRRGMGEISPGNKMEGGRPRCSPPNVVGGSSLLEGLQSKSREMPSHAEIGENNHQHFEPVIYTPRMATYGGSPASISNERGRNCSGSSVEPYAGGTHRWFHGVSPGPDYRTRDSEEQLTRRMRGSYDNLGFRPYLPMVDRILTRDLDVRSQVQLYGQHDHDPARSNYLGSHEARYHQMGLMSYGHPVPADMSFRMNTSPMLQYPPRGHQLNHQLNGYGFENPRAHQPGFGSDPLGFASGHHAYSRRGSSGWPNEQ